jgi:hypothetical protein
MRVSLRRLSASSSRLTATIPPSQVEQAALLKAANPEIRVLVYRNLVKALPWFTSVREKINDPAYAGWFLHFSGKGDYHVPQCDSNWKPPRCTELYHDQVRVLPAPAFACNCGCP